MATKIFGQSCQGPFEVKTEWADSDTREENVLYKKDSLLVAGRRSCIERIACDAAVWT